MMDPGWNTVSYHDCERIAELLRGGTVRTWEWVGHGIFSSVGRGVGPEDSVIEGNGREGMGWEMGTR